MTALKVWCSYSHPVTGEPTGFSFTLSTPVAWDSWTDTKQGDWAGNQCLGRFDKLHHGERPYSFDYGYEFLTDGESGNNLA